MKQIIFPVLLATAVLFSCNEDNKSKSGYDLAKDNARRYVRTDLGTDSTNYEETNWGVVEPRRVDFLESKTYRVYHDTVLLMEERVRMLDDSITIEYNTNRESSLWQRLRERRDRFNTELEQFRMRQAERETYYDKYPEYDGYWIYHEYKLNGEPKRVYILMGDTVKYTPSGLIYK